MCGISGIINFKKKPSLQVATAMSKKISHRGPDFKTTWSNDSCVVVL